MPVVPGFESERVRQIPRFVIWSRTWLTGQKAQVTEEEQAFEPEV